MSLRYNILLQSKLQWDEHVEGLINIISRRIKSGTFSANIAAKDVIANIIVLNHLGITGQNGQPLAKNGVVDLDFLWA